MRAALLLMLFSGLLMASEPASVRIQAGHAGGMLCVAVAPDGRSVVSGGADGRVLAWDVASWLEVRTVGSLPTSSAALCWAGAWVVAADEAAGLHAWPAAGGAGRSLAAGGPVADLVGWPDGLVAVATATGISWWRPGDPAPPTAVALPCAPIVRLALAPDGTLLAIGGRGLAALDPGASSARWLRPELDGSVVAISPDGRTLVVAKDSALRVVDMVNAKARLSLPGAAAPPAKGARLQPGSERALAVRLGMGGIKDMRFDAAGRLVVAQLMRQGLAVVSVAGQGGMSEAAIEHCWPDRLAPLGATGFVVASHQGARPWVVDPSAASPVLPGPAAAQFRGLDALWTSSDGRWLASACFGGELRLWDLHAARLHQRVRIDPLAGHLFLDQARRRDGLIAIAVEINDPVLNVPPTKVALVDPRTGALSATRQLDPALGAPLAVASAPDGSLVVLTTDFQRRFLAVRVAADGAIASTALAGFGSMQLDAWRPGLDPAAGVLAVGGEGWVGLWDLATGAARWSSTGEAGPRGRPASFLVGGGGTEAWASGPLEIARFRADGPALRLPVTTVASRQGEWNDPCPLLVDGAACWHGEPDGSISRWQEGKSAPGLGGGHNLAVSALRLLPDGTLASAAADGSVALWPAAGGPVLLLADADDWVVATGDGLFDGSPGCGRLLALTAGGMVAGIEQLAAARNRPDQILERLGHGDPAYRALLHAAYQRRLARLGGTADASFDDLPVIRLGAPSAVVSGELAVAAELEAGRGLARWQVWLDGVPQLPEGQQAASGRRAQVRCTLVVPAGRHRIEAACVDTTGRESLRAVATVEGPAVAAAAELHVFAVGVSRYRASGLDLGFAHQDAIDLAAALARAEGAGFARVRATVVTDDRATTAGIRTAGAALAASRPGDTVVMLVAGHGQYTADGIYCLLTHDCDPADLARTALPFSELEAMISAAPALRRLVLLDACESGEREAAAPAAGTAPAGDGAGRSRGLRPTAAAPRGLRREERFVFNDLRRRSGAVVLSSSTGDQLSYERDDLANGLFTQAILECLSGSGDADQDGVITRYELRDAVTRRVADLTGNRQTPVIDRDNLLADLRLPVLRGLIP